MSDNVVRVGRKVRSLKTAPEFDGYTKVVINLDDDYAYAAGSDEGRTLTLDNPWGTRDMAENILSKIRGFQYQPYSSPGTILDPAAEIGDGVVVNNLYSGIYRKKTIFGPDYRADISAPGEEETDHEFPYVAKRDRQYIRRLASLSAELSIQSDKISAKVSRTGGDVSSFGWDLEENSWLIHANGTDVLKATQSGLEIYGKITATSGRIGGFDILSDHLSTNSMTWGGTNATGVYVGNMGIQLGKNFKVDSAGNLQAASGKFTGNVSAGSIEYGESDGYFNGGGISSGSIYGSRLAASTVTTSHTSDGINTSLGYADLFKSVDLGINMMTNLKVVGKFEYQSNKVSRKSVAVTLASGKTAMIYYLGWGD